MNSIIIGVTCFGAGVIITTLMFMFFLGASSNRESRCKRYEPSNFLQLPYVPFTDWHCLQPIHSPSSSKGRT